MSDGLCIIPVRACDALDWFQGKLLDRDLFFRAPLKPEAAFIVNLPDWRSYFKAVARLRDLREAGAVCVICRTGTPVVASHLVKYGAVPGLVEHTDPVKTRYILPPDGFFRWLGKFKGVETKTTL